MSPAKQLYELQTIDIDMERATEALRQVQAQLSDNSAVLQAKAELEEESNKLKALQKKQQEAEWEIDDLRAKTEAITKKLYGGSVKNPKELTSLQQEADSLNKRIVEKEDLVLDLMSEREVVQEAVDKIQQRVDKIEKDWRQKEKTLLAAQTDLARQIADNESRRQTLATALVSSEIDLYEHLRAGKRKPTVAKIEQGRCQGCRITLPMSKLQQVRAKRDLVQCDSCERILYLE